jgi:hypothetical protein
MFDSLRLDDDWLGQLHCSPELMRSKHGVKHDECSEQQRSLLQ